MSESKLILGPTFEEMLHPQKIDPEVRKRALRMKVEDPLDPINLYNITWRDGKNRIYYEVLPQELTDVEPPIVVLYSKGFPTGSHKVGAAYSVLIEKELTGEVDPAKHSLVWPSTGNYGIGGAWLPCGEWGGFVWFSLNPDVEPLADYLSMIPQHLDPYHFERMAWKRDVTVEWDCNWKTSMDAFHENYHVQGIHPQLQWYLDDVNVQIDCYDKHSRYLVPFATISPRVAMPSSIPPAIDYMMRKAGMDPAEYEGRVSDIRHDLQRFIRANAAAQGKDFSELNDDQLTDDYHYSIFPNVSMNIHAEDIMMFRQRPHPTDPNKMLYDLWMFELVPEGEPWPERPRHQHFKHGDRSIGQVLDQDAFNLPLVQKGMQASAFKGLWLSRQELRIRHFHHVLGQYIYGANGAPTGDQ